MGHELGPGQGPRPEGVCSQSTQRYLGLREENYSRFFPPPSRASQELKAISELGDLVHRAQPLVQSGRRKNEPKTKQVDDSPNELSIIFLYFILK